MSDKLTNGKNATPPDTKGSKFMGSLASRLNLSEADLRRKTDRYLAPHPGSHRLAHPDSLLLAERLAAVAENDLKTYYDMLGQLPKVEFRQNEAYLIFELPFRDIYFNHSSIELTKGEFTQLYGDYTRFMRGFYRNRDCIKSAQVCGAIDEHFNFPMFVVMTREQIPHVPKALYDEGSFQVTRLWITLVSDLFDIDRYYSRYTEILETCRQPIEDHINIDFVLVALLLRDNCGFINTLVRVAGYLKYVRLVR